MPGLLDVYHRLPYPAKVLAAGARGLFLNRWRYDEHSESLVSEFLSHERWSNEQWGRWQEERIAFVLERAARRVPFYRDQWAKRRRLGDRAAADMLENWPVLAKEALRRHPRAFLADDCNPKAMFVEHTSGTTGTPLHVWLGRKTVVAWFALFEARARRWHGVSRNDRWAILGGQLIAATGRDRPPFWVWNGALKQLYLSAYHLKPDHVADYLDALDKHEVCYLLGYPSGIYQLAREALEQRLNVPKLAVVLGNAEPLLAHQRDAITSAFGCPARETYGMAEIAAAAGECESGRLHAWPEAGYIEILSDSADLPVRAGGSGRLFATGLLNADMPLVRYDTGDRARLAAGGCSCGRSLPVLAAIEGRADDVLVTPDGRTIGRLDPVFKADLPIREAQIIQEDWNALRVLFVPSAGYTPRDGDELVRRIGDRVGDRMGVTLESVEAIPRSANGKFRAVVSRLDRPDVEAGMRRVE